MEGGGEFLKLTSDDIDSASNVLKKKTEKELTSFLKEEREDDLIILEDSFDIEFLDEFSSIEAGDLSDNFSYTMVSKIKTIAFQEKEVEKFIRSFIESNIDEDVLAYFESLEVNYSLNSIDWDKGEMIVDFEVRIKTYPNIDIVFIEEELKGRSSQAGELLLSNQTGVSDVDIDLWPFWVNTIPNEGKRIKIVYPVIN